MLVGRIQKQPLQVNRFTVNFAEWLDTGETISAVTDLTITGVVAGWNGPWPYNPAALYTPPPPTPTVDANPLLLYGTYVILQGTMVQVFVQKGTIGRIYQLQFLATGTSNRELPIEVLIAVHGP
jgi:hypothetical protein